MMKGSKMCDIKKNCGQIKCVNRFLCLTYYTITKSVVIDDYCVFTTLIIEN